MTNSQPDQVMCCNNETQPEQKPEKPIFFAGVKCETEPKKSLTLLRLIEPVNENQNEILNFSFRSNFQRVIYF